jgi:RNA polymerase sigma-70 factor (ECF subfamily)
MARVAQQVESSILEALARRDYDAAATLLLEGYGGEIFGFLSSRLRDPVAAEEAFSQFSVDLWRGLPSFAQRASVRVWAYALARHAASRLRKVAQRVQLREVPLSFASSVAKIQEQARSATPALLRTEAKDRLSALRTQLPPEDQTLLLLRVQQRLEFQEIAQIMLHDPAQPAPPDGAALERETARLRKRFQLVKQRLRKLAQAEGLLALGEER